MHNPGDEHHETWQQWVDHVRMKAKTAQYRAGNPKHAIINDCGHAYIHTADGHWMLILHGVPKEAMVRDVTFWQEYSRAWLPDQQPGLTWEIYGVFHKKPDTVVVEFRAMPPKS